MLRALVLSVSLLTSIAFSPSLAEPLNAICGGLWSADLAGKCEVSAVNSPTIEFVATALAEPAIEDGTFGASISIRITDAVTGALVHACTSTRGDDRVPVPVSCVITRALPSSIQRVFCEVVGGTTGGTYTCIVRR